MRILKAIGMGLGVFFLTFIVFTSWYIWRYAMEPVATYEINDPSLENKVLIITQGSEYKDAVTDEIIDYLSPHEVYVKVMDISFLPGQDVDEWSALVLIHTWEYSKPPSEVKEFMDSDYDPSKVFVITTSGSGEEGMEGIDAVTGASKMEDVQENVDKVIVWLEGVLEPTKL
ncbi:hypothetical protein [Reichenbachiella sp. MALMAid0571]|uniref:hypothetical protein n=1 Tax=Reichenbachiella sp. MALMAid0571 TaxID=3143939 RepID=UPI0032DF8B49